MTNGNSVLERNRRFLPELNAESRQFVILAFFLMVLCITFSLMHPRFFSPGNALAIVSVSAVLGVVALGQVLALIVGGFDLSTGGVVPLGGVVYAILVNREYGVLASLLVVVVVGLVVGLINGLIIAYGKINPLITTLATLQITGGLALTLTNGVAIPFKDPGAGALASGAIAGIPTEAWFLLVTSGALYVVLRHTAYGRRIYAVGDSPEASRLAGIHTGRVTISVYAVCAALAAIAGILLASQLLTGSGTSGTHSNLESLAAAILGGAILGGGRGGVMGTLIGVFIIGTLANGMALLLVPAFYQTMATGMVLLVAVAVSQLNLRSR